MPADSSDPRSPSSIVDATRSIFYHAVYHQLPSMFSAALELPAKTLQRYQERDTRYDARQGAIGDPYRGFIDPGLADEIDERRRQADEALSKRRQDSASTRGSDSRG
ncbi:hypothetical protein Slin15195_G028900 [Septoria linicola]|uniref:Uncharacterized protein n=1 Tax=Septoria linicola TaxID=215465 RepID=A0A9Q9ARR4_9PEZI|nr:hypothetical protein Slin14017_G027930 [Septoria linicola]USW49571.1 hypothetical protein Slin15195_G028900 [Septoria linicola]